ncbi:MAG: Na+/H+ antiporter NhaA, partial [Atopobiaceae bacterium]|nr:Na+/H+ antiporter NhaA [Atopobiaceae bacterium]
MPQKTEQQTTRSTVSPIISVPTVARRVARRPAWQRLTSNGTVAAAVMVFAAILAIIVANSSAYEVVHEALSTPLTLGVGDLVGSMTFEEFVNDFLMAIFFLLVGIELKYEMTVGQLRRPRQAALPMLAAVGGVVGPSL